MRKVFTIIIATLLIAACSKKDEYPQLFTPCQFNEGVVKMYTKTGEVTSNQAIEDFSQRVRQHFLNSPNSNGNVYSFSDDINEFERYDLDITFLSETKGEITIRSNESGDDQEYKFTLLGSGEVFTVSMSDTLTTTYYFESPLFRCKPQVTKRVPIPMGGELVSYLRPLYVKRTKDEVAICLVSIMSNRYYSGELVDVNIIPPVNNLISTDYLQDLQSSNELTVDTIAYKESFIILK